VLNLLQEWLLEGDIGSTIFPEKSRWAQRIAV
jgi:hypothetical protein